MDNETLTGHFDKLNDFVAPSTGLGRDSVAGLWTLNLSKCRSTEMPKRWSIGRFDKLNDLF